jgi:peroxiredoxin
VYLVPFLATALAILTSANPIESTHTNTESGSTVAMSRPEVGQIAPEFDYLSSDWLRRRLRDVLREEGSVLLVFANDESSLRETETHAAALREAGIVPVVLVGLPTRETRDLVGRLGLEFGVLSDPTGFVASQYGMRDAQGWFVIDRSGRIRGCGRDAIHEDVLAAIATGAMVPPEVRAAR